LITDPFFYAVAIPAVFLLGLSKSGFGAGFGSLGVPLMALAVTVPEAAAIFMPLLLVMDVLTLKAFRRELDWPLLRFMLPFGLLGIGIGAWLFKTLDARTVAGVVGVFAWAFLAQRKVFPPKARCVSTRQVLGRVDDHHIWLHQLCIALGWATHQCICDTPQACPDGVHRHVGRIFLRHQPEQVVALRLAGLAGYAQLCNLAGVAAHCATGCVGGREGGTKNQPTLVLPVGGLGHVLDRCQTDLGWIFGQLRTVKSNTCTSPRPVKVHHLLVVTFKHGAAQAVSQNMSPISTPGVLLVSLAVVTPLRLAVTSYALKKAPGSYTGSAD
jgi:hypothetical protein